MNRSGKNGELTFLDIISILSFLIGIENLDLNVTQEDAQRLEHEFTQKTDLVLTEIHNHLEEQDKKIDHILEVLENGRNL